ncbi:MAG: hypothetical protein KDK97_18960, partial [Verrucomicrobiales bacterium]|nr:hypothetical protein [Verrucomicrobiales bacterium]
EIYKNHKKNQGGLLGSALVNSVMFPTARRITTLQEMGDQHSGGRPPLFFDLGRIMHPFESRESDACEQVVRKM